MWVVATHVQKGGVGKTTTATNLAYVLSQKYNKKVIIFDLDASQGQSTGYLAKERPKNEIGEYLEGKCSLEDTIIEVKENLWLASCFGIGSRLKMWSKKEALEMNASRTIKRMFQEAQEAGMDIVICDMSPAMSHFEKLILLCVDEVINILEAETFSREGLEIFLNEIQEIQEERQDRNIAPLLIKKLVINKVNASYKTHKKTLEILKTKDRELFIISYSRKIADAQEMGKFVFELDSNKRIEEQYTNLAKGVLDGMGK